MTQSEMGRKRGKRKDGKMERWNIVRLRQNWKRLSVKGRIKKVKIKI